MPQIRKYKYKFRTEILCGALWGKILKTCSLFLMIHCFFRVAFKVKKVPNSFCCFHILGVNLLVGTESGLYLLDRSGYGKGKCLDCILSNLLSLEFFFFFFFLAFALLFYLIFVLLITEYTVVFFDSFSTDIQTQISTNRRS